MIPEKNVLVVTSVDFGGEAAILANTRVRFELFTTTGPPDFNRIVLASGDAGLGDAAGGHAGSVSVPPGVVIKPGTTLCAGVKSSSAFYATYAWIHGFIARDK